MKRIVKLLLIVIIFSLVVISNVFAISTENIVLNETTNNININNSINIIEEVSNSINNEKSEENVNSDVNINNEEKNKDDINNQNININNNEKEKAPEELNNSIEVEFKNENINLVEEKEVKNVKELVQIDGIWRVVINGKVDYNYTGLATNENGTYYVKNGTIKFDYQGTVFEGNKAYIIEKSKVWATCSKDTTKIIKINNVWRMIKDGKVDYNYTGIGTNENGTYYLENGIITFNYKGIYKDETGTYVIEQSKLRTDYTKIMQIDGIWRMVVKGKIEYNYTGLGTNENGTYYVKNGTIKFDYQGTVFEGNKAYIIEKSKVWATCSKDTTKIIKINNVWRMIKDGKVDYNYTGIGTNENGTYYLENGIITFNYKGTYKDETGTYVIEQSKLRTDYTKIMQIDGIWRMVVKGKIEYNYTGLGTNENGTYYVKNGTIKFDYQGTIFEGNKAYIIEKSKVWATCNKDTTKIIKINNVWRMIKDGKVDYNYTGIGTNENGTYYLENGIITFNYKGTYKDETGTYVIEQSKLRTDYTKIMQIDGIWRMVVKGKIEYNYTGLGTNENGTYYVKDGTIKFDYQGTIFEGNKAYIIEKSKVWAICSKNTTEVMKINNIWRMVVNGKVNYNYTGIGLNSSGIWILQNGTINYNYTGEYKASDGSIYNVKAGKVREVIKNAKHPGTMWVDSPVKDSKHSNNMISVSGWALSEETGDSIQIYLDDKYICDAPRKERPDVFATYPNSYGGIALNPQPGFEYNLNISAVSNGSHILRIVNISKDKKTIIQSREVKFNIVRLEKQHAGIDVSKYQGEINWQAVKNSGVSFAILRIGYYLQSSNTVIKDPYFESYYNSCRSLGIAVGGYFYSYAFNGPEAAVEAEACLSIIRGKYFDMPIFLDVEDNVLKNAVANGTTNVNELTNASITFCDTMIRNGYQAGVYASKNFFETYLNAPILERYNIWLAHYTSSTDYKGKYDIWQYTSQGTVPGINGPVDLDWSMKKFFSRK